MGKQMEGDNRQRRNKARAARERGNLPSEEGVTTGGSQQRHSMHKDEDHADKLDAIRRGKQKVIRENTPEPRPGSRPSPRE
jgi:hypothetical protein